MSIRIYPRADGGVTILDPDGGPVCGTFDFSSVRRAQRKKAMRRARMARKRKRGWA